MFNEELVWTELKCVTNKTKPHCSTTCDHRLPRSRKQLSENCSLVLQFLFIPWMA